MEQHCNEEELKLIWKKGVYPYEWMDDTDKFKEAQLPPIKAFYSKLRLQESQKTNTSTHNMYMRSSAAIFVQDYHDLYVKSDVLLLSDVVWKL
jgi:hypothetical protein